MNNELSYTRYSITHHSSRLVSQSFKLELLTHVNLRSIFLLPYRRTILSQSNPPIEEHVGFLPEHLTFLHLLVGLVIERVPFATRSLAVGYVVPRVEGTHVHGQGDQLELGVLQVHRVRYAVPIRQLRSVVSLLLHVDVALKLAVASDLFERGVLKSL